MSNQRKLDEVFSMYIRLRDSGTNGYGGCISCGKVVHWKKADAGHFISRRYMSLRYNEKNCNLQCRACNRFDEGNKEGYIIGLEKKYGDKILSQLQVLKHTTKKISPTEIKEAIKYYQQQVNKLIKEKCI